jgi:hydroxyethylthiazole kinase-like uncharacterized protein yjeF
MNPIVSTEEMRAAEREYVQRGGSLDQLMQRAGAAVAARITGNNRVLVLVGPGNNGGDGLVAARRLRERLIPVTVYTFRRPWTEDLDATIIQAESDHNLEQLQRELATCEVVIDALLGTGQDRPLEGLVADIVNRVNTATSRGRFPWRLAVDVPTGVNTNTGQVGTTAFRADVTVTLGFAKRGLFAFPGADYAGQVEVADIGLPTDLLPRISCVLPSSQDIAQLLPRRSQDSNKGKSGTVVVIGGSYNYTGAPVLVAMGAYRVGSGLVRMAVPPAIHSIVAAHATEPVFVSIPGDAARFGPDALAAVAESVVSAKAFVLGPGLGQDPATVEFVHALLERLADSTVPGVLDADGLNAVARRDEWWKHAPANLVLTPHPGEMARLLDTTVAAVQSNRFAAASDAACRWGKVVLLKGAYTIVADPTGIMSINPTGSPNLATAGTGDVLSGIVAGLLAQGLSPRDAAVAGAWLHGAAGQRVAERLGDAGTVASDLLAVIPEIRHSLVGGNSAQETMIS